jgi:transposase-like protein
MAGYKPDIFTEHFAGPSDDEAVQELDALSDASRSVKSRMNCVCPGCGKMHIMQIRWIGRGVPRKFCQGCRERERTFND